MAIETMDPAILKPHPLNVRVYGAEPVDRDLQASIRDHGVLHALIVTDDDVIVSGHRRCAAAMAAGLSAVPVLRTVATDPLAIERLVLEWNRQRAKTNEQRAREVQALADIAAREAARRKAATQAKPGDGKVGGPVVATVATTGETRGKPRKAREDVAATLGMSPRTAADLATAAKGIDDADAAGDHAEAEAIREALNDRGAAPAANMVRASRAAKAKRDADVRALPPKVAEALATRPKWLGLQSRLGTICNEVMELMNGPGGKHADRLGLPTAMADAGHQIRFAAPAAVCPACKGTGKCGEKGPCRGHGWMNADLLATWKRLHGGAT